MKAKQNLGWQRFFRIMREWGILSGLMLALHALFFFAFWIVMDVLRVRSTAPYLLLTVPYLIGLAAIFWLFFRRLGRADTSPDVREARAYGLPATAKVLSIEPTGFRSGPRTGGYHFVFTLRPFSIRQRIPRREYQMRLRVTRPGEPDYEAELAEYLPHEQVPAKGSAIPVKVHPQRPEVVVLGLPDSASTP